MPPNDLFLLLISSFHDECSYEILGNLWGNLAGNSKFSGISEFLRNLKFLVKSNLSLGNPEFIGKFPGFVGILRNREILRKPEILGESKILKRYEILGERGILKNLKILEIWKFLGDIKLS